MYSRLTAAAYKFYMTCKQDFFIFHIFKASWLDATNNCINNEKVYFQSLSFI